MHYINFDLKKSDTIPIIKEFLIETAYGKKREWM
jgi:hypothetical protein